MVVAGAVLLAGVTSSRGPKFFPDDPLWNLPPPLPVSKDVHFKKIDQLYDFVINIAATPGEKHPPGAPIIAQDINTLGEVPDDLWYTNRHYRNRMSIQELRTGPGSDHQPVPPFRIIGAKTEGITPGFRMSDARGEPLPLQAGPFLQSRNGDRR
jgi:hypothetical protein